MVKGIGKAIADWLEINSHPAFHLIEYKDIDPNVIAFPNKGDGEIFLLDELDFVTPEQYRKKYEREPYTYHFYEEDPTIDEIDGTKETPIWDKVWRDQVSTESQKTMEVLIGRMLYKIGQYDDYQVAPFLRGIANTGKSMIVDFVGKKLLPTEEVGIISATMDKKFGLEDLYEKRMVAMTEIPDHIENVIAKSVFQEMISGGTVSVSRKYKGCHMHQWTSQTFLAGNCNPDFADDSGSIARRLSMTVFNNTIQAKDQQTDLHHKLNAEIFGVLFRCIKSYRAFAKANQGKSWWDICDDETKENRENISEEQNYLAEFLTKGSSYYTIVYDEDAEPVSLTDFTRAYRNYMKIDLGLKQRIKITSSDWSPFQERGYKITQNNMCKSCDKKAVAGKTNAFGQKTGACCDKFNRKNRVKKITISNMEIKVNKDNDEINTGECLM